jgi:integrase
MRQGELKGLQWNSIDWQNMTVTVRHSRCDRARDIVAPKNNRIRHIPLVQETYRLLVRKRREAGYVFTDVRGRPFNHGQLSSELEKVCKKAGIRRITWHILRHTFATHLAMKGVPLHVVQTLLGHSTITMTMRYAHVAPSALRSAIEVLNSRQSADRNFGQPAGNSLLYAQIDKRSETAVYQKTP